MKIRVIYNDIFPFKGYKAMALWPFVFVRNKSRFDEQCENHEKIHCHQQVEVLCVAIVICAILWLVGCSWWSLFTLPLYLYIYGIDYAVRLCLYGSHKVAYKNISVEQEAYNYQNDLGYLPKRKHFEWVKYITKKTIIKT